MPPLGSPVCLCLLVPVLAALLAFAAPPAMASGPVPKPDAEEKLHQVAESWLAVSGSPGVTLAVIAKDGTMVKTAAGVSRRSTKAPMTPDARMSSGSIGKTYFAAVILQLAAEKKVKVQLQVGPTARYGTTVEPFAKATFDLKKLGDVSPVVTSPFGLHVIRYNELIAEENISFEEAKEKLREGAWPDAQVRAFAQIIACDVHPLQNLRVLDYLKAGNDKRKLCSLYLSIMDRMGLKLPEFGDAKDRLAGI